MKTKTIIRMLSVFFALTLFFTSCTTEEIAVKETESNTVINTDENLYSRGAPSVMEVYVEYYAYITQSQKDYLRNYYAVAAGLITYDVYNGKEIWTVNEGVWNAYDGSCQTCSGPLGDVILEEEEVKEITLVTFP